MNAEGASEGAEEKAVDTAVFIPQSGQKACLKLNGTCRDGALFRIMPSEPAFPTTSSRTLAPSSAWQGNANSGGG